MPRGRRAYYILPAAILQRCRRAFVPRAKRRTLAYSAGALYLAGSCTLSSLFKAWKRMTRFGGCLTAFDAPGAFPSSDLAARKTSGSRLYFSFLRMKALSISASRRVECESMPSCSSIKYRSVAGCCLARGTSAFLSKAVSLLSAVSRLTCEGRTARSVPALVPLLTCDVSCAIKYGRGAGDDAAPAATTFERRSRWRCCFSGVLSGSPPRCRWRRHSRSCQHRAARATAATRCSPLRHCYAAAAAPP